MIKGRFFLMGCPRSGTTLLQSMLAAHSQIHSFPETNYINTIVGNHKYRTIGLRPTTYRQKLWSLLVDFRIICGIANRSAVPYFLRTVENIGRPDLAELMPKHPIWIKDAVQRLFKALDRDAIDHGYESWLEKTPLHYAYLDFFENNVSSAKYIHIIRNGVDVIASLYDAALRYPGTHWEKDFSVIDQCIACWNIAVQTSEKHANKSNHLIVFYDDLIDNPCRTLSALCLSLGLPYEPSMLEEYRNESQHLVLKHEQWKTGIKQEITKKSKFRNLFSKEELEYIQRALHDVNNLLKHRISAPSF